MTAYKLQLACLIITLYISFLFFMNRTSTEKEKHTRIFSQLSIVGIVYLLFDIATVYSVNHLDTVNPFLNRTLHLMYLLGILTFLYLIFHYLSALCGIEFKSWYMKALANVPYIISVNVTILSINSLEYIIGKETNYSMGIPAYACYSIGVIYFIGGLIIFLKYWHYIEKRKVFVLLACLTTVFVIMIVQMIFPETLVTSLVVAIMVAGAYLHIENNTVQELEHIHEETIHSFAEMLESRDKSTGGHVIRTTVYVRIIAEKLRTYSQFSNILTKDYVNSLVHVAPMHDIGKIAVKDSILQKTGNLTPDEYEQMKQHTVKGAELIQRFFQNQNDTMYSSMSVDVALYHHEKWNGQGYPNGLKAEEIPLSARIMAVADVFDAVSQHRCYRKAMSLDESFSIIKNGSGTDFDPVIVSCFLSARDEVEKVYPELIKKEQEQIHHIQHQFMTVKSYIS